MENHKPIQGKKDIAVWPNCAYDPIQYLIEDQFM